MERRKIVSMWQRGTAAALATLVRVEGSSYRAPGARLLIEADGAYAGSVSGGCLEAEIVRKAPWMVRQGAALQQYSTLFDDTADIPYGLGCGGTVDVLIEPSRTPECEALLEALALSLAGHRRSVRTAAPAGPYPLWREISDETGTVIFRSAGTSHHASQLLFSEELNPPQRLFIFGAGDDARPLVQVAALLGWTVLVCDGRAQWARGSRFPGAERVDAANTLTVAPGSDDAVVVMTHSYEQDRTWLEQVLPCRPRYLGLLGSRHRSALLVGEAAAALHWPLDRACERLFSPAGLDLGGDGAEAIALSIASEIQACVQGKLGTSRRLTPALIDQLIAQGGTSRYLQAQCAL